MRIGLTAALAAALWAPSAFAQTGPAQNFATIHVDHFGYRPRDPKIAVLTQDPKGAAEIRSAAGVAIYRIPGDGGSIVDSGIDPASGEHVFQVDFSGLTAAGTGYYLAVPSQSASSMPFNVSDAVYAAPLATLFGSFLFARCGMPKPLPYASHWADTACHASDHMAVAASGMTDYGTLDLSGGYHDAGNYDKYVSVEDADDREFFAELAVYDLYPSLLGDGSLNIPENANGAADVLDVLKIETDWMLAMQVASGPDAGRVLSQLHQGAGAVSGSPPSVDMTVRSYLNPSVFSDAYFTATIAYAARVFRAASMTAYANRLQAAALASWAKLAAEPDPAGRHFGPRLYAAAAVFALQPSDANVISQAQAVIDGWQFNTGYYAAWPDYFKEFDGVWLYLRTPGATPATVSRFRTWMSSMVDQFMSVAAPGYGSHVGCNGGDCEDTWSSNEYHGLRGSMLALAAHEGITGSHTLAEVNAQSLAFLHYVFGLNPMGRVYMTNVSSIGGERSVYSPYHQWFCEQSNGTPGSNAMWCGKPSSVTEPGWPFSPAGVADEATTSQYGPAPGIVVGGPNRSASSALLQLVGDPAGAHAELDYIDTADESNDLEPWNVNEVGLYYTNSVALLTALVSGASASSAPATDGGAFALSDTSADAGLTLAAGGGVTPDASAPPASSGIGSPSAPSGSSGSSGSASSESAGSSFGMSAGGAAPPSTPAAPGGGGGCGAHGARPIGSAGNAACVLVLGLWASARMIRGRKRRARAIPPPRVCL